MVPALKDQKVGTVTFSHADQPMSVVHTSPLEKTYAAGETTDVPLGTFLSRPVQIYEHDFGDGSVDEFWFEPWTLFFNDSQVKRRIEGFRLARGKLNVRFVITGNPMLLGRYIAWFKPRATRDVFPLVNRLDTCRIITASQHPHMYLDPMKGEGGEMVLPFFCPENWIDLASTTSLSNMGEMRVDTIATLKHCNSATAAAQLKVFAWLEDAELAAPTARTYDYYTPQSVEGVSLVTSGAVSGVFSAVATFFIGYVVLWEKFLESVCKKLREPPVEPQSSEKMMHNASKTASAVAKASGALSHIPVLAPYALATEMAAGTFSRIASIFGFSRAQVGTQLSKYKNYTVGELATTNTNEAVMRLGVDVNGQLTVDSRTVGLDGTDEMAIQHIVQKECHITSEDWRETDLEGTSIVTLAVTPSQFDTDTTVTPARSVLSSQAAVASLFNYWRGTIIYRFTIVASAFHRGKLRITYDPLATSGSTGFNETYSRIIDIEETRDFEIPVHWHAHTPWLKVPAPPIGTTGYFYGNSILGSPEYYNGMLRVEVLNKLTSPDPSLGIAVNVIVSQRMTTDAEFASPSTLVSGWTFTSTNVAVEPQSVLSVQPQATGDLTLADGLDSDNMPEGADPKEGIGEGEIAPDDPTTLVFFGEAVKSLRTMVKRYECTGSLNATHTAKLVRQNMKTSRMTRLEYVMSMFMGWRGTMRHKVLSYSNPGESIVTWYDFVTADNFFLDASSAALGANTNPEVELPFYYGRRFADARRNPGYTASTVADQDVYDPNNTRLHVRSVATGTKLVFQSAGDDFSCFFFVGLPPVYPNT